MGLFKKNKTDESEDFILDFGTAEGVPEEDKDDVEKLSVTLWDDRKPHRPSHAMTVDEILGNTPEPQQETPAQKEEAGGAGTEVFRLSDYGISMSDVLMSGNVKTAQDCTDLVTAVTAALVAGKVPVLLDSMAGVYAVVTAVAPGYQIGGTLFGDMGDYIIKADVIIAVDAIYLHTQPLSKE